MLLDGLIPRAARAASAACLASLRASELTGSGTVSAPDGVSPLSNKSASIGDGTASITGAVCDLLGCTARLDRAPLAIIYSL